MEHLPERDRDPVKAGCARRGRTPTMTAPWSSSTGSLPNSTVRIPALAPVCGKGWKRR